MTDAAQAGAFRLGLVFAIFAGQEAAGQRAVGDDADAISPADLGHLALEFAAVYQVVMRLERIVARQVVHLRGPDGLGQAPGGVVGAAQVTHLALVDQVVQGAQGFFNGGIFIVPMGLVQVDVVGIQAAQRGLGGLDNVGA